MKQLCQFRSYLLLKQFLVCPYKLEIFTLTLWVRCFAEEGTDQLNKIKFFSTESTAHGCQNVLVKTKQIIYYDGLSFSIAIKIMSLN